MTAHYALDLAVNESGGPEHVRQALDGTDKPPANYSFESDDKTRIVYHVRGRGKILIIGVAPGWGIGMDYLVAGLAPLITTSTSCDNTSSNQITLVAVQPRGSCPSERPKDELDMGSKHMAEDLDALRRHLGQDKITVLGHSNGACIALNYAIDFSPYCHKAILISTQILGNPNFASHIESQLAKRAGDARFAEATSRFRKSWKSKEAAASDEAYTEFVHAVLPLYFHDPEKGMPIFEETTSSRQIQCWPTTMQRQADGQPSASIMDSLHKVKGKTLFISGADDFICGVDASSAAMVKMGSIATHVVYGGCGHMPWIERREEFFRDVVKFMEE
jgi:pimeloyl-ACP methyl ester carboxylesterase